MVKMSYLGITNPAEAFAALRPFRKQVIEMQMRCRPFGTDYVILEAVNKALDTAAYHFTREPNFFALKPEQSKSGGRG
jgi:hypothetical protein